MRDRRLLVFASRFLGLAGVLLFLYGFVATFHRIQWPPAEASVNAISTIATLFGAFLTFIVIYFPSKVSPPLRISLYITAPLMIATIFFILLLLIVHHGSINFQTVNGVALIALASSLLHLLRK